MRRRQLVLDLSKQDEPVRKLQLPLVSPDVAAQYAQKTTKTLTRDINVLKELDLIEFVPGKGYRAKKSRILAFLPPSPDGGPEAASPLYSG